MDLQQKLLLGIMALKEIKARQDVAITAAMYSGKTTDNLVDEFHEEIKTKRLIEDLTDLLNDPILTVSETVLTSIKDV